MEFSYPLEPGSHVPQPSAATRLKNMIKTPTERFRRGDDGDRVELMLAPGQAERALAHDDFPLVFLTHNDRRFLPSFFAHYRRMGVTRFICVDDGSSDGTVEFLLAQPDADVHVSNVRYVEARRGKVWREMLIARYGIDRWYLLVDSDEYFVYETFPDEKIDTYCTRLDRMGIRRLAAPMLDFYPVGDLGDAVFNGDDDRMPWEVATHFDGDGYRATLSDKALSIKGGVRQRSFGVDLELIKYPLVRWDRYCSFGRSIHWPRPAQYNFAPALGAILHFKIFSDVERRARQAVADGQYFNGAEAYKQLLATLDKTGDHRLGYERSIRYGGVADLIKRGFMAGMDKPNALEMPTEPGVR